MKKYRYLRVSEDRFEKPFVSRSLYPRLWLGGFVATLVMTLWVYVTPLLGLPNVDFAGILGSYLAGQPSIMFSGSWWAGMVWHFLNGTLLFPLIYAYWIYPVFNRDNSSVSIVDGFPYHSVLRGEAWGLILFAFSQMVAMPLAGGGIFSTKTLEPALVLIGCVIGHLIYGATFGALTASQKQTVLELRHNRAA